MSEIEKAKSWLKNRQKDLARSLIKYKLTRDGERIPDDATLDASASKVIDEANSIIKTKGKDILASAADRASRLRRK
ncbi:MAG: hypothetical protein RQ824_12700 [bacterium]|nr:hypothetical protein [bacterium]